jgi:hypothetical protein
MLSIFALSHGLSDQGLPERFCVAMLMKLFLTGKRERIKNKFVPQRAPSRRRWRPARLSDKRQVMLSVLIETMNDEATLPATLASLVGGVVDGAVREVIVCDRGSTDQTGRIADLAGCTWLESGGLAAGVGRAKGEWLLFVEPGARLIEGWTEPVRAHTTRYRIPAHFTRSRIDRPPFLSRVFSGNRALANGLLIPKGQALALSKQARSAEAMARGLAMRRLTSEIRVASDRKQLRS